MKRGAVLSVMLLLLAIRSWGGGFAEFISHYDILQTIAGTGLGPVDTNNYWQPSFEGALATSVTLSRPHVAMADNAGEIFIVDKDSHSVLKLTADGTIHTVAGTHVAGFNGDGPAPATSLQLNFPNGLWVLGDGSFYILDTGNGRVRRVDVNGIMTTVITDTITGGRGLWAQDDGALIYYADNPNVKKWTPNKGIRIVNNRSFIDLGILIPEPGTNTLIVTDRGANRVYRLHANGSRTPIAGDGSIQDSADGIPALTAGLYGVRAVWLLSDGGYLLGTHEGTQVSYVDQQGKIHLFLNGAAGAHAGDGQYFYTPEPKIAQVRYVNVAPNGNILITENDGGFVRMINFTNKPPVLAEEPPDQTVIAGSVVKLAVSFSGSLPISFQWRKDGIDIPGATNSTFFLSNVQPVDDGIYTLFLHNAYGTAITTGPRVTVTPPPAEAPMILLQPQNKIVPIGGNVTFEVTAAGTDLSYQWLHNRKPIPGANGTSLPLDNVASAQAGLYRVVISNSSKRVVSRNATLRVIRPVEILSAPLDQTLTAGSTARLRVRAKGSPRLSYQWLFNDAPIRDAIRPTLVLKNISPAQSGQYSVRVSNAASSVTTPAAAVAVNMP